VADPGFDTVLREVAGRGGGDAELSVTRTRDRRYEAREGRLDGIALADTVAFGLRVFRDGRMGFSYGFHGDATDFARMVEEAIFCADASDPDPAYGLPDASGPAADLPLYDPSVETVAEAEKGEFARILEAGVLARDPRVKRVRTAALRETVATVSLFHSRGFSATRRVSLCSAHVETVAEENGDAQTGYGFGVARSLRGLNAAAIADEGATRALRMLGAVRPKTGEYKVVLENAAAAELLDVLIPSFLASQVAKGKSMFAGKVGKMVASRAVTIEDDPLDPGGSGAEPFDAEGTSTRRRELIAEGELRGFLADAFWGRKMGTGTTGACRRPGPKAPPTVGISNLRIAPGAHSPAALCEAVGDGILLTEFLGIHTADPVSGDFSVGASGIRIAGGALAGPLHGFAVSGNILGLLETVEASGSDFRWFGNVGAPSLLVRAISVGGD
jgi:PmbA protein